MSEKLFSNNIQKSRLQSGNDWIIKRLIFGNEVLNAIAGNLLINHKQTTEASQELT